MADIPIFSKQDPFLAEAPGLDDSLVKAVGQFMLAMANAERMLLVALQKRLKLDADVFTEDMKFHHILRIYKTILDVGRGDHLPDDYVDTMQTQLARLERLKEHRNKLAYWFLHQEGSEYVIKKRRWADDAEPITINDVNRWSADAEMIWLNLVMQVVPAE